MPKSKPPVDETATAEDVVAEAPAPVVYDISPELQNLIVADLARWHPDGVIWRPGHLEHVARQYVADPVTTEQRYHDDLSVARQYSRELFDKLVAEASSQ